MARSLLVTIRFHDCRYHGAGDWPPSPARLFQALVAGAAEGGTIPDTAKNALAWLERLAPPEIIAPPNRPGQAYHNYVPNNDLDAKGGHPDAIINEGKKKGPAISFIKSPKQIRPRLFDADTPLLYCWHYDDDPEGHAKTICAIAERLYQLGRGVDMAFATADILGEAEAAQRVEDHGGAIHRPALGSGDLLACPAPGTLDSLIARHKAMGERLRLTGSGKKARTLFSQPPKPRLRKVAYDSPPSQSVFLIRKGDDPEAFAPWPADRAVALVECIRDAAAERLTQAFERSGRSHLVPLVERLIVGRGADTADREQRLHLIPLPSIGHDHADRSIRRIVARMPAGGGLDPADVFWALNGLEPHNPDSGELLDRILVSDKEGGGQLRYYGLAGQGQRRWRTVTAAVLPGAVRRRIDPERLKAERAEHRTNPNGAAASEDRTVKNAAERLDEEAKAAQAVHTALRHAGIHTGVERIAVQREPFHGKEPRAEAFAPETRFNKHALWHVAIDFSEPRRGPMIIGNGRFLGLGLMAPIEPSPDIAVYSITVERPMSPDARSKLLHYVRRALMALDRDGAPNGQVSRLFSGHEPNGAPARDGTHSHVFLAACASQGKTLDTLLVVPPDRADRTAPSKLGKNDRARFDRVTHALETVRAGPLGVLALARSDDTAAAPLLGPATDWQTLTPYRCTRHPKGTSGDNPAAFVADDVRTELARRGMPRPDSVHVGQVNEGPRGGLTASVTLHFATPVDGPLLLGRGSHEGEGVFRHMISTA